VHCLVIDDGSTDGTAAAARAAGAAVVTLVGEGGLGAGVRRGLEEGVRRGAAVVAFCDADGEYAPEELAHVVRPILDGDADYVVGSRFRGRIDRMLPHRRFGNRVLTSLLRWIARVPLTDGQSGYRALSAAAARAAHVAHDYNYAQVLTLDLVAQGCRYAEVPISYHFREAGNSFVKLGAYLRNVVPAVLLVVNEHHHHRRRSVGGRSPRRAWLGACAAAVAIAFASLAFASLAGRATIPLDGAQPFGICLAALVAAGGMTALAWPWRDVMIAVGADPPMRAHAVAAYFSGEIGKYVPGAIWPVVGRGERARRLGVAPGPAYASVVVSLVLAYLAAGAVFAAALPAALVGGGQALDVAWALLVVPAFVALLHPTVLRAGVGLAERLARRPVPCSVPPWRVSIRLAASYLPAWVLIGAATVLVGTVLVPGADPPQLFAAAVGSWIVGFLVIPAPGGVGVREVTFAAVCGLGFDRGVAVAATARRLFVAVDHVGYAIPSRALHRTTVLDDVRREALAIAPPAVTIESPVAERVGRGPSHGHGVVRVVVGEQTLTAERDQVRDGGDPGVGGGELLLEADAVHGIRVRDPAHDHGGGIGAG
jgi:uncharacterized membrane protein YbhN (UPF0104 family)